MVKMNLIEIQKLNVGDNIKDKANNWTYIRSLLNINDSDFNKLYSTNDISENYDLVIPLIEKIPTVD